MRPLFVFVIIYWLALVGPPVALTNLLEGNSYRAARFVGVAYVLLLLALGSPWYIHRSIIPWSNFFTFAAVTVALSLPVMVALFVLSEAERHRIILAMLAGLAAVPVALVAFAILSCMGGDCL